MKITAKRRYCLGAAAKRYEKTPKGKAGRYKIRCRYNENHKLELRARQIVRSAVYRGTIQRPDVCPRCNGHKKDVGIIHAHHPDYSNPYRFAWLCDRCHRVIGKNGELFLEYVELKSLASLPERTFEGFNNGSL